MFDQILTRCEIVHENAIDLPQEEFAMLRRNSIGASDSSAIIGTLNKFKTADDIMTQKLQKEYTAEEAEISKKVTVRMGRDLEGLVLNKASDALETLVVKLPEMYRIKEFPWLTVNFDGIAEFTEGLVPVEAKVCTTFGDKYYDFTKANVPCSVFETHKFTAEAIEDCAKYHGVSANYLVQLQQQLLGCGGREGILAVLRVKDWSLYLFRIPRYDWIIDIITVDTYRFWTKLLKLKG